jgi:hypothetical protein
VEKKFNREFLLACATEVLTWIGLQDPMFADRIDITKTEYHLDDLQVLSSYVSRVLDLGEHMYYCERDFMKAGYVGHLGPRACMVCDVEFNPGTPGQEICDNRDCASAYFAARDSQFEAKAE